MKRFLKIATTLVFLFIAAPSFAQIAYEITWWYGGVQYQGLLVPQNDDTWTYRVRYVANGYVKMVDQTMTPVKYSDGIALHGCCPVYAGTYVNCSTYSPDNLVLLDDGNVYNYDDNGQSAVQAVKPIYTTQAYNRLCNTVFRR